MCSIEGIQAEKSLVGIVENFSLTLGYSWKRHRILKNNLLHVSVLGIHSGCSLILAFYYMF